ncbi:MAG: AAA family ATPase [Sphaerochaetaceae bacterium]|nr:AAA family ATPase [Sphaerochaetaceae bacterium]
MNSDLNSKDIIFNYDIDNIPDVTSLDGIIGQDRAYQALRVGLRTDREGYNLFVSGDFGTGKLTAVRNECEKLRDDETKIKDVLYLADPASPISPYTLLLPAGRGSIFKKDMSLLCEENYHSHIKNLIEKYPEAKDYLNHLLAFPFSKTLSEVNLVLDRRGETRRPFIIESHPSFENLFGYYDGHSGHMGIHIGSYQRAAGGFLVLTAEELLAKEGLWDALKRHLDSTGMAFTDAHVQGEIGKEARIRPEPIPLYTKVILLGGDDTYETLTEKDEQFLRLFKVAPQFDYLMKSSEENIRGTVGYLYSAAKKNHIELEKSAVQELLRYSSWFAESREELTCQFSLLGDLMVEASLNSKDGKLKGEDILKAIDTRNYITSITEEKINQEIASGDLLISVTGSKIGIVNGLAVMDRGLASFGTPAVISATVAPGSEGIINIEHEAGLSGEIHDKGLLILEGYLRKMYARSFPLSVYAGICFEQNYSEVDGDSASSSELYALLSAIGELPVRQDIAVTGSVNQMGILQPVGGINEKITGFWKTCQTCGLTGKQGVIIPRSNIKSLILPREIEEAIKEGVFHIWALSNVEEGMELLTGMKSSVRDRKGNFANGSFNRQIEDRLRRLYEAGKGN